MSLAEVVSGVIPLIPGSSGSVEAFFHAHGGAPQIDRFGWHHQPIDYRTRDGVLLHIQLTSDWENAKAPDVVRVSAAVDSGRCVDSATLRDELARGQRIQWTALSSNQEWSATDNGKFLTIGQLGRCVTSVIVDIRRQPRVVPPVRPFKGDPSGQLMRVPAPGH